MTLFDKIQRVTGYYKITPNTKINFGDAEYIPGQQLYSFGINRTNKMESEYRVIVIDIKKLSWFETNQTYVKSFFQYTENFKPSIEEQQEITEYIKNNNILFKEVTNVRFI